MSEERKLCSEGVRQDAGLCMDISHKLDTLFRLIQVAPEEECRNTVFPAINQCMEDLNNMLMILKVKFQIPNGEELLMAFATAQDQPKKEA